jgi:hypothetical protein
MEINRDAINRLLTLNDKQLKAVIQNIAKESGIDPAEFNIDTNSIASIRGALSGATDEELRRIAQQYEENQKGRR